MCSFWNVNDACNVVVYASVFLVISIPLSLSPIVPQFALCHFCILFCLCEYGSVLPSPLSISLFWGFLCTQMHLQCDIVYPVTEVGVSWLLCHYDKTWQMCLGSGVPDLPHGIRLTQRGEHWVFPHRESNHGHNNALSTVRIGCLSRPGRLLQSRRAVTQIFQDIRDSLVSFLMWKISRETLVWWARSWILIAEFRGLNHNLLTWVNIKWSKTISLFFHHSLKVFFLPLKIQINH